MERKTLAFILFLGGIFFVCLSFPTTVFSLDVTKPDKEYRNVLVLENKQVYGVLNVKSESGKYIPVELMGIEKIKVLLYKFIMQNDVGIEKIKTDKLHQKIVEILADEKQLSTDLLKEWTKDKDPTNRDKADYILGVLKN